MEKVSITIDGKKTAVDRGMTVFEAARSAGVKIPHLCYRSDLPVFSGCRICVVEVEGAKNLVASCSHPVSDGMVVKTQTDRVLGARKMVVELLLSDHPFDCMTCEASGSCKLEKYAYQLGVKESRFQGEKHDYPVTSEDNPVIVRDYNKCIVCGRCVSVCNEVQCASAIDFLGRGFQTKVGVPFDRSLMESTCVKCGQCIGVCPVGALTEKSRQHKGREWELNEVTTICGFCGVGCSMELHVKDNEIIKVTSDKGHIVNRGNLCAKGRFGWDFVSHADRVTAPLRRRNGKRGETERFEEIEWDEAIGYVARELKRIKETYGPDSIGFLSSAKCTNEENYLMQKFARAVIGTNNVDHCARL
jgi:formate dehydrogenase alpha subunit